MRIKAIQIIHPSQKVDNSTLFAASIPEIDKFIQTTGIQHRYVAPKDAIIENYFVAGIRQLNIDLSTVDALVTVTQTPSKLIPSLSNYLHKELQFREGLMTFDLISGCSGYTEALALANTLFKATPAKRIIVCNGDFSNHIIREDNFTVLPLFSDVASVTLLEADEGLFAHAVHSYAEGYAAIDSIEGKMTLNGLEVFQHSTLHVAKTIEDLLKEQQLTIEDISAFYFHQANLIINNTILRQLKVATEKAPLSIKDYGNSSSASIPLTLALNADTIVDKSKVVLSGFGVGFKICNVLLEMTTFDANITAFESC